MPMSENHAPQTVAMLLSTPPEFGQIAIADSAANVFNNLPQLSYAFSVNYFGSEAITLTDPGVVSETLTQNQLDMASPVIESIATPYKLTVTGALAAEAQSDAAVRNVAAIDVADSAANVSSHLDMLEAVQAQHHDLSIVLSDSGTPQLSLTLTQLTADADALGVIGGSYGLKVSGVIAADAATVAALPHVAAIAISDSADNVLANASTLNGLIATGHDVSIAFDDGVPALALTPDQLTADAALLRDVTSNYTLAIDGTAANLTLAGTPGRGTVVAFTGRAAHYQIMPAGDGVSFTVTDVGTGRASVDHLSGITALEFSDGTDFIAQAPATTGAATSGNVVALYAAALGRTPDVAGLAYYEMALVDTPGLSLNQLAQQFLLSPESADNPAHQFAASAAGDGQFVTALYNALLHRAPEAGAVSYYQAVIGQSVSDLAGRAQVLTDFSSSSEFLNDVRITAQHPADAQHFLYVI